MALPGRSSPGPLNESTVEKKNEKKKKRGRIPREAIITASAKGGSSCPRFERNEAADSHRDYVKEVLR